jgi:hypothetical protein
MLRAKKKAEEDALKGVKTPNPPPPPKAPEEQVIKEVEAVQAFTLTPSQEEGLRRLGWLKDEAQVSQEKKEEPAPIKVKNLYSGPLGVAYTREIPGVGKAQSIYSALIIGCLRDVEKRAKETARGNKESLKQIEAYFGAGVQKKYLSLDEEHGKVFLQEQIIPKLQVDLFEALVGVLEDSMTEAVEEALLATGKNLLVYPSDEDALLGITNRGGKNLLGIAWMYIRSKIGGYGDPRIEALKGKKVALVEDWEMENDTEQEILEEVSEAMARCLLPQEPNGENEKKYQRWEERLEAIQGFILENKWWPFPMMVDIVLEFGEEGISVPKPLKDWTFWCINKFYDLRGEVCLAGAREHRVLGKGFLEGIDKKLKFTYKDEQGNKQEDTVLLPAYSPEEHGQWLTLKMGEIQSWWSWFLSEQTQKLSPEKQAELVGILCMNQPGGPEVKVRGSRVDFDMGSEVYSFNFEWRYVKARQSRKAFHKALYYNKACDTGWTLVWLAVTCFKEGDKINGVMNLLPNLWQREANYGWSWEKNHPTRIIREESGAPLNWETGYGVFGLEPVNRKFTWEVMKSLLGQEEYKFGVYTDKNATVLMAGANAAKAGLTAISYPEEALWAFEALENGANPLLVLGAILPPSQLFGVVMELLEGTTAEFIILREFGVFRTACDGAKVTKILNRVQQGASFNECWAVLVYRDAEGNITLEVKREASAMSVRLKEEPIVVMATKEQEQGLLASMGVKIE